MIFEIISSSDMIRKAAQKNKHNSDIKKIGFEKFN